MRCVIANDHGAVELAQKLIKHLNERGIEVKYLGTDKNESVDYPDQAEKCAKEFLKGGYDFSIVLCGTGIGISIVANKVKGIRCALCTNEFTAEMSRKHNDANMLAMGARVVDTETALKMVEIWLNTECEEGRHRRRIDMIEE